MTLASSLKNPFGGGTISGNVVITGNLTINGTTTSVVNTVVEGTVIIDVTNTEALLARKNADGGDVLVVDTNTPAVTIGGGLTTAGAILRLATAESTVVANDVLGRINFLAPLEASGTDAILTGASIVALAEAEFTASVNATSLAFQTGASETATTKMTLNSAGNVGIKVVPKSTWSSAWSVLQIGGLGAINAATTPALSAHVSMTCNMYYDGTNNRRIFGEEVTAYTQVNGTHVFYTAPSDVADSIVTLTTAMIIALDGDVTGGTAGSWALQNEAATDTNPTVCPGAVVTYGLGGTATSTTIIANSLNRFSANATGIGFFATTPAAQVAHLADPTDLTTCISAISTLIDNLKTYGLMAVDP